MRRRQRRRRLPGWDDDDDDDDAGEEGEVPHWGEEEDGGVEEGCLKAMKVRVILLNIHDLS